MSRALASSAALVALCACATASATRVAEPQFTLDLTSTVELRRAVDLAADGTEAVALPDRRRCTLVSWRAGAVRPRAVTRTCGRYPEIEDQTAPRIAVGGRQLLSVREISVGRGTFSDPQLLLNDLTRRRTRQIANAYAEVGPGARFENLVGHGGTLAFTLTRTDLDAPTSRSFRIAEDASVPGAEPCPSEEGLVAEPPPARLCIALGRGSNTRVVSADYGSVLAEDVDGGGLVLFSSEGYVLERYAIDRAAGVEVADGRIVVARHGPDAPVLEIYDERGGALLQTWPAPGLVTFDGVSGGFAVYHNRQLHLVRLRDGAHAVAVAPDERRVIAPRITPDGLFYLYGVRGGAVLGFEPAARLAGQFDAAVTATRP